MSLSEKLRAVCLERQLGGGDVLVRVSTLCDLAAEAEALERDAKRWSGFWEASPIYLREDLVSAKTGELVRGRKRFVIYVDLPDRALLETAIDAALAKEQP